MIKWIKKMIGDKKDWRQMQSRAKALPTEYTYVFHKIQHYMWSFSSGYGSGMDMMPIFDDVLGLFEEGAAAGKRVLEVTGEDVAAFSDALLQNANTYTENSRNKLNSEIKNRVNKHN